MEWSVVEVREGFIPRVYYRVMCWVSGHSAVLDYKFKDSGQAEWLARYMNSDEETRSQMDYAAAWQNWYP